MNETSEFITLLGGAAVAWPLAARAQQVGRMRRIGVLVAYAESDPEALARVIAFRQGLKELGWVESRNVQMEYRWGAGDPDRARTFATELVSLRPDVILSHGTGQKAELSRVTRPPFRERSACRYARFLLKREAAQDRGC